MRKLMYFCDFCGKETKKKHLSITFDPMGYSGYVEPYDNGFWEHIENAIRPNLLAEKLIKQFCSTWCLSKYFLRKEK